MEEKKKGMSPILIVILSIIGICLVGFGIWYGVNYFKGEEKPIEEQPSSQLNNQPSNNDGNILNGKILEFPQSGDNTSVKISQNEIYKVLNNVEKDNLEANLQQNGEYFEYLKSNNYYVVLFHGYGGVVAATKIFIYDLEGNKKYDSSEEELAFVLKKDEEMAEGFNVKAVVFENKLHFVSCSNQTNCEGTLRYYTIDLTSSSISPILIQEFYGESLF